MSSTALTRSTSTSRRSSSTARARSDGKASIARGSSSPTATRSNGDSPPARSPTNDRQDRVPPIPSGTAVTEAPVQVTVAMTAAGEHGPISMVRRSSAAVHAHFPSRRSGPANELIGAIAVVAEGKEVRKDVSKEAGSAPGHPHQRPHRRRAAGAGPGPGGARQAPGRRSGTGGSVAGRHRPGDGQHGRRGQRARANHDREAGVALRRGRYPLIVGSQARFRGEGSFHDLRL